MYNNTEPSVGGTEAASLPVEPDNSERDVPLPPSAYNDPPIASEQSSHFVQSPAIDPEFEMVQPAAGISQPEFALQSDVTAAMSNATEFVDDRDATLELKGTKSSESREESVESAAVVVEQQPGLHWAAMAADGELVSNTRSPDGMRSIQPTKKIERPTQSIQQPQPEPTEKFRQSSIKIEQQPEKIEGRSSIFKPDNANIPHDARYGVHRNYHKFFEKPNDDRTVFKHDLATADRYRLPLEQRTASGQVTFVEKFPERDETTFKTRWQKFDGETFKGRPVAITDDRRLVLMATERGKEQPNKLVYLPISATSALENDPKSAKAIATALQSGTGFAVIQVQQIGGKWSARYVDSPQLSPKAPVAIIKWPVTSGDTKIKQTELLTSSSKIAVPPNSGPGESIEKPEQPESKQHVSVPHSAPPTGRFSEVSAKIKNLFTRSTRS